MACEESVDAYLNSYCASATLSTVIIGPTVTVTTTQAVTTITQTETVTKPGQTTTTTVTASVTCPPSGQCNSPRTNSTAVLAPSNTSAQKSTLALGALLGLCMILLIIVTTGWVWTFTAMKKKERENRNLQMKR